MNTPTKDELLAWLDRITHIVGRNVGYVEADINAPMFAALAVLDELEKEK